VEPRIVRYEGFEGIHLVADVRGDPDAWPVVLMHGGGQTRHAWGQTASVLADAGWRTISLDLRGHGDSEWALNGDYSFTAYSADCVAIADQLGRPPVLVGASLGGVAAILAEGNSDRVVSSGLVIVDITHRSNPEGIARIRDFMASGLGGFATLDEAADAIASYTPNRPRRVNPAGLMKVLRQRPDGRWYWHWDPKFLSGNRTEVPREDFQALFEVALRNIRVPTLLVRGCSATSSPRRACRTSSTRSRARSSSTSAAPRTWSRATRTTRSPTRSSTSSSTTSARRCPDRDPLWSVYEA